MSRSLSRELAWQSDRLLRSAAGLGFTAAGIRVASAYDGTPTGDALWLVVSTLMAVGLLLTVVGLTAAYGAHDLASRIPVRARDARGRFLATNPALRLADDVDRPLAEIVAAAERFAVRQTTSTGESRP